jgi:hypothetical protein
VARLVVLVEEVRAQERELGFSFDHAYLGAPA